MSIKQKSLIVLQVSIYLLLGIALIWVILVSDKKVGFGIFIGIVYMLAVDFVDLVFKGV